MLLLKNVLGLCAAIIGFLICLVFRNTIMFYSGTNYINDKILDAQLITLGDYSVQGKIPKVLYKAFTEKIERDDERMCLRFESYLIEKLERWLMK